MPVPMLPPELQREIFEIAVRFSPQDSTVKLNLSLVARHVQSWVEREFYKSVTISSSKGAAEFIQLANLKPPGFFTMAVHTLLISNFPGGLMEAQIIALLSICAGVQCLAFWHRNFPGRDPVINQLSLRRLFMPLSDVQNNIEGTTTPHCLSGVTHLNMAFFDPVDVSDLEILGRLPCLTHVALHVCAVLPPHVLVVITSCPALRALVIIFESTDLIRDEIAQVYSFDPRIVLLNHPSVTSSGEAGSACFGLDGVWVCADHIITHRIPRN
ncbi:hypothetical protein C8F04DRAFT_1067448 [Mycena alexandri]|uniref:Uncharacterized protein n=1 Tax=Mycena alexandri TaxID=1745969 RepID=A0AAD6XAB4_9AGAR|nr:hypothetical protein C8F04DRAFT_1067448 [Mycena alexandri]